MSDKPFYQEGPDTRPAQEKPEKAFPYSWFPANRNRQLQCERLYHAVLRFKKESVSGGIAAIAMTDLYTQILSINKTGDEPLPAFAAQLAIEAAMQD